MQPNIKVVPAVMLTIVISIFLLAFFNWLDTEDFRIEKVENSIKTREVDYTKYIYDGVEGLWIPLGQLENKTIYGVQILYEGKIE